MTARAAEAFFDNSPGDPSVLPSDQSGRVKLHHFHVAQRQSRHERHRHTITALVAGWGVVAVHRRPTASRHQNGLGLDKGKAAVAHIDEQHTGQPFAILIFNKR